MAALPDVSGGPALSPGTGPGRPGPTAGGGATAFVASQELVLRRWPGEATAALHDRHSGRTLLVSALAAEILQIAGGEPRTEDELAAWLSGDEAEPTSGDGSPSAGAATAPETDDGREVIADTVRALEHNGLLRRVAR